MLCSRECKSKISLFAVMLILFSYVLCGYAQAAELGDSEWNYSFATESNANRAVIGTDSDAEIIDRDDLISTESQISNASKSEAKKATESNIATDSNVWKELVGKSGDYTVKMKLLSDKLPKHTALKVRDLDTLSDEDFSDDALITPETAKTAIMQLSELDKSEFESSFDVKAVKIDILDKDEDLPIDYNGQALIEIESRLEKDWKSDIESDSEENKSLELFRYETSFNSDICLERIAVSDKDYAIKLSDEFIMDEEEIINRPQACMDMGPAYSMDNGIVSKTILKEDKLDELEISGNRAIYDGRIDIDHEPGVMMLVKADTEKKEKREGIECDVAEFLNSLYLEIKNKDPSSLFFISRNKK